MRRHATCGLTPAHSIELIARAWQVHAGRSPGQRHSFRMPFGTAVTMVLLIEFYRQAT